MPKYRCADPSCPRRPAIEADSPPKCYTCGQPYTPHDWGQSVLERIAPATIYQYQNVPPPPASWASIPRGQYDASPPRSVRVTHVGLTSRGLELSLVTSARLVKSSSGYLLTAEQIAGARQSSDDGRCAVCPHTECGCPCATCTEQAKRIDLSGDPRPICQCHRCDRVRRLHRHQATTGAPLSPRPGRCEGCGAVLGHESLKATEYSALLEPGTGYSVVTAVACSEACRDAALDAAASRIGARRQR